MTTADSRLDPGPPSRPQWRRFLDWFLRDPRTGRIGLVQWPNPALVVFAITRLVAALNLLPERAETIRWVGTGALIAWAADEVIRGVSPVRRLLGLLVLVAQCSQVLA